MPIALTVTGVEATGQMFRERTLVLGLNGRECQYQSKHEVCVDSVVLLALDSAGGGQESRPVRGRVKSLEPLQSDRHQFRICVELETPQSTRVVPNDRENPVEKPTANGMQDLATRILSFSSEIAKSVVVHEIGEQMETLKNSLSQEIKESVQATVASAIKQMAHDAVKQQITEQYQAITQALHADLPQQLAKRLAESDQLRSCFDGMKEMIAERLSDLSKTAAIRTDQDLNTRVAAIRQSCDQAIAEMQDRVRDARANLGDALARTQAAEKELGDVTARAQESLKQIKNADGSVADRLDEHFRIRLNAVSAELSERLDQVAVEGAARWVSSVKQQMDPYMKRVDERLAILGGGLQLAQIQHDKLTELARTVAANFEKDMRAIFLRHSANT
jgi:hypothetical protein